VNLSQLALAIAERFAIPEAQAKQIVAFTFGKITETLKSGRRVYFRDFGAFTKRIRPGKWVRHPKTGKMIWIPPGPAVRFGAAPALLGAIALRKPRQPSRRKRRD